MSDWWVYFFGPGPTKYVTRFSRAQLSFIYKGYHRIIRVQSWSVLCSPLKNSVLWMLSPSNPAPDFAVEIKLSVCCIWTSVILRWPHCASCMTAWDVATQQVKWRSLFQVDRSSSAPTNYFLVWPYYRMESSLHLCQGTRLSRDDHKSWSFLSQWRTSLWNKIFALSATGV